MAAPSLDRISTRQAPRVATGAEVVDEPDIYEGHVSRVDSGAVFVTVDAFSTSRTHGPCLVVAPAGAPVVGDAAYVAFTDNREPIAIVPGVGAAGSSSGPVGGVLSGTLPNPGFAVDMATQAELNAAIAAEAASRVAGDSFVSRAKWMTD